MNATVLLSFLDTTSYAPDVDPQIHSTAKRLLAQIKTFGNTCFTALLCSCDLHDFGGNCFEIIGEDGTHFVSKEGMLVFDCIQTLLDDMSMIRRGPRFFRSVLHTLEGTLAIKLTPLTFEHLENNEGYEELFDILKNNDSYKSMFGIIKNPANINTDILKNK